MTVHNISRRDQHNILGTDFTLNVHEAGTANASGTPELTPVLVGFVLLDL